MKNITGIPNEINITKLKTQSSVIHGLNLKRLPCEPAAQKNNAKEPIMTENIEKTILIIVGCY